MKYFSANKITIFKMILFSYLRPRSKKTLWQKIQDIYLPNIMKGFALSCLLLTILTWMGINNGLKKGYEEFKKDPYTTSISISSNRFLLNKYQIERINSIYYDANGNEFNTEGKGESIYREKTFAFSTLDLIFYDKEGEKISFRGRTVGHEDKKMLYAIGQKVILSNRENYTLGKDWKDNEKGIIVSKHLVDRLGYKVDESKILDRLVDKRFRNRNYSFRVPVNILVVVDRMPLGDFIISEEFNYNRIENSFNPFDMVQRFNVTCTRENQKDLEALVKQRFKTVKEVIEINRDETAKEVYCEVVFKNIPFYKTEKFEELRNESSKYFIATQFKNSPFKSSIDFYDWKSLPKKEKQKNPEFITIYLKEKYIDHIRELNIFFRESIGGIKMDETILNMFENYHRDMRRFNTISFILYILLIGLGIFVSIAVYIRSVQATMHRLGVLSAFGVSAGSLSGVLAVESIIMFFLSLLVAMILYFIFIPMIITTDVILSLPFLHILMLFLVGSAISFAVVFITVRHMVKKPPYSLMAYRS